MSNLFRDRLLRGDRLVGTILSLPTPELAEIASEAGFDWLFLDMEHGPIGPEALIHLIQAVRGLCAPVVRVPENEEMWIKKSLDAGATGVIIPRVNTAGEAARAVHWSKYPPEGGRGVGFARANLYGTRFQEHVETANQRTAVIVQIEHIEAVRNIGEILAVPGIDALFIGPYDLSASLGKPGRVQDNDVREALSVVRAACSRKNMPIGIFAADIAGSAKALTEGYTLVCCGVDVALFSSAAAEIVRALKQVA
jgi:2-dehydro-3-deoxyglucarate aldolase/4-hydroxy-2-oxoheptanedioate aldolase